MDKDKVELGDEAEDIVSGFKGTVVTIAYYFGGCVQASLTPKMNDKGEKQDKVIKKAAVKPIPREKEPPKKVPKGTGGPSRGEAAAFR
jgi:hypothetical protein